MTDDLTQKVVKILAAVKRIPAESIRPEATLEELGIDSLDKVNILFELEGEFNIDIPDEEARQITSVEGIVERLRAMAGKNVAGNKDQPSEA
jgi:acyl carrier protein